MGAFSVVLESSYTNRGAGIMARSKDAGDSILQNFAKGQAERPKFTADNPEFPHS